MEIELRAKITNEKLLENNLKLLAGIAEKIGGERQVDIYLKHENDIERRMVVRIRKNYENNKAILTFKGKAKGADVAWADYDTPIENPDKLEAVLTGNGYVYVCLVDKIRQSFTYNDFEINIDNVRDLGLFIEIEKQGKEDEVEVCKKEIIGLLSKLGISENNIINQGYVQLMINK